MPPGTAIAIYSRICAVEVSVDVAADRRAEDQQRDCIVEQALALEELRSRCGAAGRRRASPWPPQHQAVRRKPRSAIAAASGSPARATAQATAAVVSTTATAARREGGQKRRLARGAKS